MTSYRQKRMLILDTLLLSLPTRNRLPVPSDIYQKVQQRAIFCQHLRSPSLTYDIDPSFSSFMT